MDVLLNNKIAFALMNLMVNMGGQYIMPDLAPLFRLFNQVWMRKIILFAIFIMTTRDFKLSLLLTIAISVTVHVFLNEGHSFCLVPRQFRVDRASEPFYSKYTRFFRHFTLSSP